MTTGDIVRMNMGAAIMAAPGRKSKHKGKSGIRGWLRTQMATFVCASLVIYCMTKFMGNVYDTLLVPATQSALGVYKIEERCAERTDGEPLPKMCSDRKFQVQWLKFAASIAQTAVVLAAAYWLSHVFADVPASKPAAGGDDLLDDDSPRRHGPSSPRSDE